MVMNDNLVKAEKKIQKQLSQLIKENKVEFYYVGKKNERPKSRPRK